MNGAIAAADIVGLPIALFCEPHHYRGLCPQDSLLKNFNLFDVG